MSDQDLKIQVIELAKRQHSEMGIEESKQRVKRAHIATRQKTLIRLQRELERCEVKDSEPEVKKPVRKPTAKQLTTLANHVSLWGIRLMKVTFGRTR